MLSLKDLIHKHNSNIDCFYMLYLPTAFQTLPSTNMLNVPPPPSYVIHGHIRSFLYSTLLSSPHLPHSLRRGFFVNDAIIYSSPIRELAKVLWIRPYPSLPLASKLSKFTVQMPQVSLLLLLLSQSRLHQLWPALLQEHLDHTVSYLVFHVLSYYSK